MKLIMTEFLCFKLHNCKAPEGTGEHKLGKWETKFRRWRKSEVKLTFE